MGTLWKSDSLPTAGVRVKQSQFVQYFYVFLCTKINSFMVVIYCIFTTNFIGLREGNRIDRPTH
jgi:hypothetical protein